MTHASVPINCGPLRDGWLQVNLPFESIACKKIVPLFRLFDINVSPLHVPIWMWIRKADPIRTAEHTLDGISEIGLDCMHCRPLLLH